MSLEERRLILQTDLEEILGSRNVYYQPPASISMKYPCIVYNYDGESNVYSDDIKYLTFDEYTITHITTEVLPEVLDKLASMPYSSFVRQFKTDGLYHYVYKLVFTSKGNGHE